MDFNPGFNGSEGSFTPDELMVNGPFKTEAGTLVSGAGALTRGTLLGKVTVGAAGTPALVGTGNGTLTMDATTPILAGAQAGAYKAVCVTAATNGGTFNVIGPDGRSLGLVAVGATFANQLKFVIADGSTDFVVGDTFTVTVAAGSGKLKKSLAAAVDGSQVPTSILAADSDATSADKACATYIAGEFNVNSITFGTGHTAASVKDGLRDLGIYLKTPVAR